VLNEQKWKIYYKYIFNFIKFSESKNVFSSSGKPEKVSPSSQSNAHSISLKSHCTCQTDVKRLGIVFAVAVQLKSEPLNYWATHVAIPGIGSRRVGAFQGTGDPWIQDPVFGVVRMPAHGTSFLGSFVSCLFVRPASFPVALFAACGACCYVPHCTAPL